MEPALPAMADFLTGLIDAMAGGDGLVQIPTLFSTYPNIASAMLIGTNKVTLISGAATTTVHCGRAVRIYWGATVPAVVTAFVFSLPDVWVLMHIPTEPPRRALPFVLAVLLVYAVAERNLGADHTPGLKSWREPAAALLADAVIGFYDGVFSPGTDNFLMIVFVRVFGYGFLCTSASTKIVNLVTNVVALSLLAAKGHVWWQLDLVMAVANVVGSQVNSHLALQHSSRFVRKVFIVVVLALILKTAYDAFIR